MMRVLHLVAIASLIGSAAYAYSTKYESLYYMEEAAKLRGRIEREKASIAVAKAEWSLLTRPDRLQRIVDRNLDLQPMALHQLGKLSDLPARPAKGDEIGRKLEALLAGPTNPATRFDPKPAAVPKAPAVLVKSDEIGKKLRSLFGGEPDTTASLPRPAPRPAVGLPDPAR